MAEHATSIPAPDALHRARALYNFALAAQDIVQEDDHVVELGRLAVIVWRRAAAMPIRSRGDAFVKLGIVEDLIEGGDDVFGTGRQCLSEIRAFMRGQCA